jgi:hypothetical protein
VAHLTLVGLYDVSEDVVGNDYGVVRQYSGICLFTKIQPLELPISRPRYELGTSQARSATAFSHLPRYDVGLKRVKRIPHTWQHNMSVTEVGLPRPWVSSKYAESPEVMCHAHRHEYRFSMRSGVTVILICYRPTCCTGVREVHTHTKHLYWEPEYYGFRYMTAEVWALYVHLLLRAHRFRAFEHPMGIARATTDAEVEVQKNEVRQENKFRAAVSWGKNCTLLALYLWVLHPVAHLSNWFLMMPSIATKFQYINSLLFSLSLTTCFGPYGISSGEIYN